MKNYPKGAWLGHVTHFEILGPLYINGTDKNRNFVFGEHNKYDKTWQPTPKIGRGQGLRPRPKSKIWDPLYNFWTDEATASRYYIRLRQALCLQTKKNALQGRSFGNVTYFEILEPPSAWPSVICILGTVKVGNFVYGKHVERNES